MARTVGLAFKYATPYKGVPPGIEPTSFVGLGSSLPGWGFAVDVEDSMGVESGCEIPGEDDERAGGGAMGSGLEDGGCDDGASWVVGTVVTEREREEDDVRRANGSRERRLLRQVLQSMAATVEEQWRKRD